MACTRTVYTKYYNGLASFEAPHNVMHYRMECFCLLQHLSFVASAKMPNCCVERIFAPNERSEFVYVCKNGEKTFQRGSKQNRDDSVT